MSSLLRGGVVRHTHFDDPVTLSIEITPTATSRGRQGDFALLEPILDGIGAA